ncbi:hypothetical protein FGO68_gene10196 [Halteria grandinella]|uniref:RING-type domain-containing protein n=1 Tax=Halteria grandinella TaxID=5974 RepID=A0A8J8NA15_HALGN|nr:hypothetical protein FGO68_gene10196 [Halteria grandinella]
MSEHRVRCNECGNNFCISCKTEPYHVGKTCAQHEKEKNAKKCRFCQAVLKANQRNNVCSKRECKQMSYRCCVAFLPCGHGCYGGSNETVHPPCLHEDCVGKDETKTLGENSDSFCVICYVQGLGEKSVVQLGCKHIFHQDCLQRRIQQKWYQNQHFGFGQPPAPPDANANAISLKFANCPSCNQWMDLPKSNHLVWIQQILDQAKGLEAQIKEKGVLRAKHEGLDLDERLSDPKSEYYNNLEKFAVEHLNYFECQTCKNAYFGGLKACGANQNLQALQQQQAQQGLYVGAFQQYQCPKCKFFNQDANNKYGITYCEEHKETYIQYKCNFCCNIAAYHCGGANYYCMHCHDRKGPPGHKCKGKDDCPLGLEHPPNGTMKAFAVGCGMCRDMKIKQDDMEKAVGEQMKKLEEFKKNIQDF